MIKTLVTLGDSHVFGSFLNEMGQNFETLNSCHERSWSRKLAKLLAVDFEFNLARSGSSNYRSLRVLMDWIKKTYSNEFIDDKLLIIFTITEPTRFEIPVNNKIFPRIKIDTMSSADDSIDADTILHPIGTWELNNYQIGRSEYSNYIQAHYKFFNNDQYQFKLLANNLVLLHYFLKSHNIKHYFMHGMSTEEYIRIHLPKFVKLPMMRFYTTHEETNIFGSNGWLRYKKFKIGSEIDTTSKCCHYDHDAHQTLAKYIYETIKDTL